MRIVMLDPHDRESQALRSLRRVVTRVQIRGADLRLGLEKLHEASDGLRQGVTGSDVLHVADVGRGIENAAAAHTEGVLKLAADADDRCVKRFAKKERKRRIAARPADHIGFSLKYVHDGVVRPDPDLAVVREDCVGKIAELLLRLTVVPADRGTRDVAARHDKAVRHLNAVVVVEKQQVDRRIREHEAEFRVVRGCLRAHAAARDPGKQHDRLLVAGQYLLRLRGNFALAPDRIKVPHHDGERLHRAGLALPEGSHRLGILCAAAEVEAADALHCDDFPFLYHLPGPADGLVPSFAAA